MFHLFTITDKTMSRIQNKENNAQTQDNKKLEYIQFGFEKLNFISSN